MLALAILCMGAAIVIHRSKLGFGLRCIQQNEDAANILGFYMGKNTPERKDYIMENLVVTVEE